MQADVYSHWCHRQGADYAKRANVPVMQVLVCQHQVGFSKLRPEGPQNNSPDYYLNVIIKVNDPSDLR